MKRIGKTVREAIIVLGSLIVAIMMLIGVMLARLIKLLEIPIFLVVVFNSIGLMTDTCDILSNTNKVNVRTYTISWIIELVCFIIVFITISYLTRAEHKEAIEEMKQKQQKFSSKCFSLEIRTLEAEIWELKEERDALKQKLDKKDQN